MNTSFTIVIENRSAADAAFFVFQEQAGFAGLAEPKIFSNCLATGRLAPQDRSGAQLVVALDRSVRAGATRRNQAIGGKRSAAPTRFGGAIVSRASASQPVVLATGSQADEPANAVTLAVDPLGLSAAVHRPGLGGDAFGLQVPPFAVEHRDDLCCGNAFLDENGLVILSSFVAPPPNVDLRISPVPVFYVRSGSAEVGRPVRYDTTHAARCDFTSGRMVFAVRYNADGTFEPGDRL
ncbi:hypothetical protein U0C82_12125 [Fulvimarina sp. 2208YS6-2-32]|uniref:Uncharacterized protein n=1 Tax=Fulvimarina uroteuthidis TaxID=3098149 RepID=A0ABU5I3U3_9HYPH|nr:hypothetical protein [Fulvimarina sp. 2208YS6-2-32]MDY8109886.1 hypothetical protein [Fulvimarina sp. 2208YS6-2-32]